MSQTLTGAEFKAIRKLCGFSAREVAEHFKSIGIPGATVRTVYRIEEDEVVPLRHIDALKTFVGKDLFKQSLLEVRRRQGSRPAADRDGNNARTIARARRPDATPTEERERLREEQFFHFLNSLPLTSQSVPWITTFREALQTLLGDVDRVTVNINLACDINNPTTYEVGQIITEHVPEHEGSASNVAVTLPDKDESPRLRLLEDFKRQGYPFDKYHPPVGFDYHLQGKAYLGTIFLWRDIGKPPTSRRTLEIMESLRPFVLFAMSDLVARNRQIRPLDHAFNEALDFLVRNAGLSDQERRVVILQLFGHSYEQIAERLYLSLDAVRKHVKSIYRKTNTHSHSELFAKYFTPRLGF
jgi:DNA-binding CsgD family transcriptional regulator